jgi:hypothetical protein
MNAGGTIMAKNVSREFATMDDEARRRFAREQAKGTPDEVHPLDFPEDDPRSAPPDEQKPGGGRK